MGWIRLDEAIFQDDWYVDLDDAEARAWLHFILYSGKDRGFVPKMSYKLLSRHIIVEEVVVRSMIEKALYRGKIVLDEFGWVVCNFNKYNPSMTNSERQARYRERQSNDKVTGVTESNGVTHTLRDDTVHNDTTQKEEERERVAPAVAEKSFNSEPFKIWWNSLLTKFPKLPEVKEISGDRLKALKSISTHPLWDLAAIETELDKNDFLCRKTKDKEGNLCKWFDFDYLVGKPLKKGGTLRPDNLTKLMEGKYRDMGDKLTADRPNQFGWFSYDATDPLMYLRNNVFDEIGIYIGERREDGSLESRKVPPL